MWAINTNDFNRSHVRRVLRLRYVDFNMSRSTRWNRFTKHLCSCTLLPIKSLVTYYIICIVKCLLFLFLCRIVHWYRNAVYEWSCIKMHCFIIFVHFNVFESVSSRYFFAKREIDFFFRNSFLLCLSLAFFFIVFQMRADKNF